MFGLLEAVYIVHCMKYRHMVDASLDMVGMKIAGLICDMHIDRQSVSLVLAV